MVEVHIYTINYVQRTSSLELVVKVKDIWETTALMFCFYIKMKTFCHVTLSGGLRKHQASNDLSSSQNIVSSTSGKYYCDINKNKCPENDLLALRSLRYWNGFPQSNFLDLVTPSIRAFLISSLRLSMINLKTPR